MSLSVRIALAILIVAGIAAGAWALSLRPGEGRALSLSLIFGAAFGVVLQRARFCFYCNFRDLIEKREASGVLAIIAALAVGAVGYAIVFGAWLPDPHGNRLPPDAHVGPISLILPVAAFVFGVGMAISGSCLSAHLYRLGEGSPVAPFALVGAALGFMLGFVTWNPLYIAVVSEAAPVWLPRSLGYAGSLALTLLVLALLAAAVVAIARKSEPEAREPLTLAGAARAVFVRRWPAGIAGIAIGAIATAAYFRVAPLGVTAELGSLARTAGSSAGLVPETLHGLDGFRGCATAVKTAILSRNGMFVVGLVGAAFASALIAGQFTPRLPRVRDVVRGLAGGLLLGWGAMTALGCTVGVLLSGIHAGAASGWVFLIACALGAALALPLWRRLQGS